MTGTPGAAVMVMPKRAKGWSPAALHAAWREDSGMLNASTFPANVDALGLWPGDPMSRSEPEIATENPNCC